MSVLPPPNRWLFRFSVFTALATLLLICVGGLVTSHGAGMAVPDWPNTYGYNMFFFPFSQWVGGIFYEHSHRLVGAFIGLLATILMIWTWARETKGKARVFAIVTVVLAVGLMGARNMPIKFYFGFAGFALILAIVSFFNACRSEGLRWFAATYFFGVIFQGILGGLRVTEMKDEWGIFHGSLAQLILVLASVVALFQTEFWRKLQPSPNSSRTLANLFVATTAIIFLQLVLGATMRHQHAGLAIPDFPTAYGKVWPDTSADAVAFYNQNRVETKAYNEITAFQILLQMTHRVVALVIFFAVIACAWLTKRQLGWQYPLARVSFVWMTLIFLQVLLGAATIWTNKSADIATAHVAVGALSLVLGVILSLLAHRSLREAKGLTEAPDALLFAQSPVSSK